MQCTTHHARHDTTTQLEPRTSNLGRKGNFFSSVVSLLAPEPDEKCDAMGKNRRRGTSRLKTRVDPQNQLLKQVGLNEAAIGRNGGWAAGLRCWQTEAT